MGRAFDTSVDPQGKATRNNYNAAGQLVSVQRADAATGAPWQTLGTFTYDEVGRVQTATDTTATPNLTVGYRYNNLDAITQVLYPDGTSETTDYVCCGLPGVVTDRAGRKSYYDYDVMRRLSRVQDAQGNTLQMDTDAVGNMVRLVDSKGQLTRWRYDAANRSVEKKYHDGTGEAYAYAQGLLSQSKGARGQIVSYAYDANANLTGINYPNMPDVAMSYNALDDVTQITDGVGTHTFTYDNLGKLLSLDGPFADDEQTFGYDSLQRLTGQSVGRGASGGTQSQSYAYDALGRLSTLTSGGTQGVGTFTYNYVGLTDRLARLDLPNGTQTVQSYDALQRLTQVVNKKTSGANLSKFAYAYDTRDVRTGAQMQYGAEPLRQVNYTYDAVDQLTGEAATGGTAGSNYSNAFSYDAMGNRLKRETTQGSDTSMTRSSANALNQLTSVSTSLNSGPSQTSGLSYDVAGNLTEAATANGGRTIYVYDDADRLFRIEKRNAADVPLSKSEFIYDYASRKAVSQEFTFTAGAWVQSSEKRRVFDDMDVVQERNEANEVTAQIVRDGNIGGILSRSTAAGASFFGYDGNGNVTLLSDAVGNEVGRYRYDAFGNTLEIAGARASENPYRFSTKELHGASGLYDFGFRLYSASMGRWINRDPIREDGGLNLYAMINNNPVNDQDAYGLSGGFQQEIDDLNKRIANTNAQIAKRRTAVKNNNGKLPWSTPDYKTNHAGSVKGHMWKITILKGELRDKYARLRVLNQRQAEWLAKQVPKIGGKLGRGLNCLSIVISIVDVFIHPEAYDPYTLYWDPSTQHWYYGNGVPYMLPKPAPKFAELDRATASEAEVEEKIRPFFAKLIH